jgi:hypothetical protein
MVTAGSRQLLTIWVGATQPMMVAQRRKAEIAAINVLFMILN